MTMVRAALALLLLAGLYLLAVAAAMAAIVGAGWPAIQWFDGQRSLTASTLTVMALGCLPVVYEIVQAMLAVSGGADDEPGSVPLARHDAAGLWEMIDTLARRIDSPLPTEIRLIAEGNAKVREELRWFGLVPDRRLLYVGLPLLAELSTDELRAVLCHELGHYARQHTRLSVLIYRGHRSLDQLQRSLDKAKAGRHYMWPTSWLVATAIQWIVARYAWLYRWLTYALRRQQEFEADTCAVKIVGARITRDALNQVCTLNVGWHEFNTQLLRPARAAGLVPTRPVAAFQRVLAESGDLTTWPRPEAWSFGAASYFHSHPNLEDRLRRLDQAATHAPDDDPGPRVPASELVPVVSAIVRRHHAARRYIVPTRQWLADVGRWHAPVDQAMALLAATERMTRAAAGTATVADVLNLLRQGRAQDLALALAGTEPRSTAGRHQAVQQLGQALAALVGDILVAQRYAMWQPTLSGTSVLRPRSKSWTESRTLVAPLAQLCAAAAGGDRKRYGLEYRLRKARVDQRVRPAPVELPPPPADPPAGTSAAPPKRTRRAFVGLLWGFALAVFGVGPAANTQIPPLHFNPLNLNTGNAPSYPDSTYHPPTYTPPLLRMPLIPLDRLVIVHRGDTLSYLACHYGTTVADLQTRNDLGTSTVIQVGQSLVVPDTPTGAVGCRR